MGQQPNIELEPSDAPRSVTEPGTPAGWKPGRPGDIGSPDDLPWGGVFGRPGPDTGWALKLIRRAEFDRSARATEIEAVAATVSGARASLFGRAPTPADVEVALTLLGMRPDGLSPDTIADLAHRRQEGLDHAAHEIRKGTSFLAHVPAEHLEADAQELIRVLGRSLRAD